MPHHNGPIHAEPTSPQTGASITEQQLRRNIETAALTVNRSGAVDLLDAVLVRRHPTTGKRLGRPSRIPTRAFLVVAICNFLQDGTAEVTSFHRLFNQLPDDLLELLDVRFEAGEVPLHAVDHVWNRIAEACNGSSTLDGKRIPIDEAGDLHNAFKAAQVDPKAFRPDLSADELTTSPTRALSNRGLPRPLDDDALSERRYRLEAFTDGLLQATIPSELDLGLWSVDWTDHEAWARTYRNPKADKHGVTSADPDAAWGRRHPKGNRITGGSARRQGEGEREGDHSFESSKIERYFGYIVHLAVTTQEAWPDGTAPELAASMRVCAANDMDGVAPALVAMVDSMLDGGLGVTRVMVDRGYSMRSPERWLIPLSDRNVFASFDLPEKSFGRRGTHHGAVIMGGELYCPQTPDELANTQVPGSTSDRQTFEEYHAARRRLDQYKFRRRGKLNPSLKMRVDCPAAAGTARCPLKPASLSIPYEKDIPEIYDPADAPDPGDAPQCCTAQTITVPRDVGVGLRQLHPHGTKEWMLDYELRTSAERYNSSLKFEQRVQRGQVRVLGHAKNTLMLCFAAVATNIRHVRNWEENSGVRSTVLSDRVDEAA